MTWRLLKGARAARGFGFDFLVLGRKRAGFFCQILALDFLCCLLASTIL